MNDLFETCETAKVTLKYINSDKRIDDRDWERDEIRKAYKQFFEERDAYLNKLITKVYGSLENYIKIESGKYKDIDNQAKLSHTLSIHDYFLIKQNDYRLFQDHKYQRINDEADSIYESQPIKPYEDTSYEQLEGHSLYICRKFAENYYEVDCNAKLAYLLKIKQRFQDIHGYDIEVDDAYEYYTSIITIQNQIAIAKRDRYWAIFNDMWEERDKEIEKIEEMQLCKEIIALEEKEVAELNEKKFILEDTFGASEIEIDSVKRKINDLTYDLDILKDKQKHDEDLYEYRLKIIRDYTREMDNYIEKISNAKIRIHPEDDYRLSWTNRTVVEMYKEHVKHHYSEQKRKELYAKSDIYMDVSISKQMCEANGLSVEYANC